MKLDPILQEELMTYLPKSEILFTTRAKLYVHNEGEAIWQYNCEGFFLVLKDKITEVITMIIVHAVNLQVFFQMEHYSNFTNYVKMIPQKNFFVFLVPTNYIPLKFALCLESREELLELRKVFDKIEFKDHVSKLAVTKQPNNDLDEILKLPESIRLMKRASVDEDKLNNDLLFRQNVKNILTQFLRKETWKVEDSKVSRFRSLALTHPNKDEVSRYTIEKEKEEIVVKKLAQEVKQEKIRNKF